MAWKLHAVPPLFDYKRTKLFHKKYVTEIHILHSRVPVSTPDLKLFVVFVSYYKSG
jgi:hypothetical protein